MIKNQPTIHPTVWLDLESTLLHEKSQFQKAYMQYGFIFVTFMKWENREQLFVGVYGRWEGVTKEQHVGVWVGEMEQFCVQIVVLAPRVSAYDEMS